MERWAANTLRGLGIALTTILMIAACLLLLLLTLCTWSSGSGSNHSQAMPYLIGAVCVLALGIFIIARLARGIVHDGSPETAQPQPPQADVPLHISPASDEALDHLSYAVGASIALGVLVWGMTLYRMWTGPGAGHPGYSYQRPWLIVALTTAALHYLPYVLLLFRLQQKPDPAALAFAIGIPAASILHTATNLPLMLRTLSYRPNLTQMLLPMGAALVLQIVVLVFAWRANQRLGYRQEPVSLIIAGVAAYAYFHNFRFLQRVAVPVY
jgi:hypothetical protein